MPPPGRSSTINRFGRADAAPRIDDPGRAGDVLVRLVGVAVEQEIVGAALFHVLHQPLIVAVEEGDLATGDLDVAEVFMQRGADLLHGRSQHVPVAVAVTEDEMDRQAAKQKNGFRILNVSAVQHRGHAAAAQLGQGAADRGVPAVGVAEDGDFHGCLAYLSPVESDL